jgi:hypothetical protein
VFSTGWKGVLVAVPGGMVAVAVAVEVTDVEVGTNGRNGESSDGMKHPVRSRKNSNQGKTAHLFRIIPSQSYRKVTAGSSTILKGKFFQMYRFTLGVL